MAEIALWFKLWVSCLNDPELDNLSVADFGRWVKLGAFIKSQGNNGEIIIPAPANTLCSLLQVEDFSTLIKHISMFPNVEISHQNVSVTGVTFVTVTFRNWLKYQGDNSINRVRRFRENVTYKKRREEKRSRDGAKSAVTSPSFPLKRGTSSISETLKNHPTLKQKQNPL